MTTVTLYTFEDDGGVEQTFSTFNSIAPFCKRAPIIKFLRWISDIIKVNPVYIICRDQFCYKMFRILTSIGNSHIHPPFVFVQFHPFTMRSGNMQRMLRKDVVSPYLCDIKPGVQFQSSFVCFIDGKCERIITGIFSQQAGQL